MEEMDTVDEAAESGGEDKAPAKHEKVYKDDEELDDTIFIRNVARFDTTQESLKAHMETNWGETVYCLLCKDRETGESKGTAFVKFKDPESAGMCLGDFEDREMQQKFFLDGRNLFVLPALNRIQMGEVKKASAKREDEPREKKVKKPRWYRTPARKSSDDTSAVQKPHKKPENAKGKPDKRSKKNQMAGEGQSKRKSGGKGRRPLSKGGRGKPAAHRDGPNSKSKGQPQNKNKNKMMGSDKKMKKTKKVKRKG